jgi:ribosomal-protein-alanine N-acetyltransferase
MGGRARPRAVCVNRSPEAPASASGEVRLREARPPDVERIAAIEAQSFSDPWPADSFRSLFGNPLVYFVVAEEETEDASASRIVGYIVSWFVVDEAEIANIAVAPDARRAGIASRLLEIAARQATLHGCHNIYLEVRESNQAARALYRARGFREFGRRPRYYRRPVEDALVLRRAL